MVWGAWYTFAMNYFSWILEHIDTVAAFVVVLMALLGFFSLCFRKVRDLFKFPKKVADNFESLESDVNLIGTTLSKMISYLSSGGDTDSFGLGHMQGELGGRFGNLQSQSPVMLTDLGKKKLDDSGLKGAMDDNKEDLFVFLEKILRKGDTNFDIQKKSFQVVDRFLTDTKSVEDLIKEYAFREGIRNLREFVEIGGIYLRDLYFADKEIVTDYKNEVRVRDA